MYNKNGVHNYRGMKFHAPKEENLDFILDVNGIKGKKQLFQDYETFASPSARPRPKVTAVLGTFDLRLWPAVATSLAASGAVIRAFLRRERGRQER